MSSLCTTSLSDMSNLYQGSWTPKAVLIGRKLVRLNCHLLSGKDVWSDIPLLLMAQTVLSLLKYYESPVFLTMSRDVSRGERKYSLLTTFSMVYYKYRHRNTKLLIFFNCFAQFSLFSRVFVYPSRESKHKIIFIISFVLSAVSIELSRCIFAISKSLSREVGPFQPFPFCDYCSFLPSPLHPRSRILLERITCYFCGSLITPKIWGTE